MKAPEWEPPSGLLRDYVALWSPTTDAPRIYHVACGLAVLATMAGSSVYLPFGGEKLFPNLWILILGPSSFYRKSTTIAKARRTITALCCENNGNGSLLLPHEFSREALLKHLSDHPTGLMTFSEFSGFLALMGRDFMSGTKELLADLYDSPPEYSRTLNSGSYTLRQPVLSICAASQTDWFTEKLKDGDVRGGFLARFTFWPAFNKGAFLAVPPEPDRGLNISILKGLNEVRQVRGAAELSSAVRGVYSKWLERHERELDGAERVGELSAFWSRLSIVALKIAVLLQLASNRALVISPDTMHASLELVDFLKGTLRVLFAEEFATSRDMRNRQKVLRLITGRPGIKRRDLLRASSLLARDFNAVLSTLEQEGTVSRDRDGGHFSLPSPVSAKVSGCQYEEH